MNDTDDGLPLISEFNLTDTAPKSIRYYWLKLISDGLGSAIRIPVMVARGAADGPVLGLTAALHGNELNGIPVIQRLFKEIDVEELQGTIIAIPVVNIPSFLRKQRYFPDGVDLNHIMPGEPDGRVSAVYAHRFVERVIKHIDYLLDLHTASSGRINSYYVRVDMDNPITKNLALVQNADIIVHNPPSDGTLRGAAAELDIPAITLELGNPNTFQKSFIRSGVEGIHNSLSFLNFTDDAIIPPDKDCIICKKSYWIYTNRGGLLTVHVDITEQIKKGALIATIRDIFGNKIQEYFAPEDGIVIGKSVSPVNQTGGRIIHLGILK